ARDAFRLAHEQAVPGGTSLVAQRREQDEALRPRALGLRYEPARAAHVDAARAAGPAGGARLRRRRPRLAHSREVEHGLAAVGGALRMARRRDVSHRGFDAVRPPPYRRLRVRGEEPRGVPLLEERGDRRFRYGAVACNQDLHAVRPLQPPCPRRRGARSAPAPGLALRKMCARFQFAPPEDWVEEFGLTDTPDVAPRYNIAPTQDVLAVRRRRAGDRQARLFRWGLVPSWADDPAVGNRLINARAESVATRPAFRDPFLQRRCLVPAQGFYEWKKFGRAREPWLIRLKGGATFAFAGLWDRWSRGEGHAIESCALITTAANALVAPIHGRMPVLLGRADYERWLDPRAS